MVYPVISVISRFLTVFRAHGELDIHIWHECESEKYFFKNIGGGGGVKATCSTITNPRISARISVIWLVDSEYPDIWIMLNPLRAAVSYFDHFFRKDIRAGKWWTPVIWFLSGNVRLNFYFSKCQARASNFSSARRYNWSKISSKPKNPWNFRKIIKKYNFRT